jgi:NAD(P)-dependent dehydrogenase (short-subunit alcohol dehydrogenase family)
MDKAVPPVPHAFSLQGRRAIVTGSTRGIGFAVAQAFVEAGAKVIVSSEREDETAQAAERLGQPGIACDVSDDAALARLVHRAIPALGGLDILVCNAGIIGPRGPFATLDMAQYAQVMAINLRSQVVLTRMALPVMAEGGGGSTILMSSTLGSRGSAATNAYGLSKAGIDQLARSLTAEWGPSGIRVNAIAPGLIRTPLAEALLADPAFLQSRLQGTPLRRIGEVQDVASVALFLASAASSFVSGQTLAVDGGASTSSG